MALQRAQRAPRAADQVFAVQSSDAVNTVWPSGEKKAVLIWRWCPSNVRKHSPEVADQTFAVHS